MSLASRRHCNLLNPQNQKICTRDLDLPVSWTLLHDHQIALGNSFAPFERNSTHELQVVDCHEDARIAVAEGGHVVSRDHKNNAVHQCLLLALVTVLVFALLLLLPLSMTSVMFDVGGGAADRNTIWEP